MTAIALVEHPRQEELELYVCGAYGGDRVDAMETHVSNCNACADEVTRQARLELELDRLAQEAEFCPVCQRVAFETLCMHCNAAAARSGFDAIRSPLGRQTARWPLVAAAVASLLAVVAGASAYLSQAPGQPGERDQARILFPGTHLIPTLELIPTEPPSQSWFTGVPACDALIVAAGSCNGVSRQDSPMVTLHNLLTDFESAPEAAQTCLDLREEFEETLASAGCAPLNMTLPMTVVIETVRGSQRTIRDAMIESKQYRMPAFSSVERFSDGLTLVRRDVGAPQFDKLHAVALMGRLALDKAKTVELSALVSDYRGPLRRGLVYALKMDDDQYTLVKVARITPYFEQPKTLAFCRSCHEEIPRP